MAAIDRVADLETEIEALEDALCDQQLYIKRGYIVTVYRDRGGSYIAACPTLHASTSGPSQAEALTSLDGAMVAAVDGRKHFGIPAPPEDVVARCLD